jgi:hypothetical protein
MNANDFYTEHIYPVMKAPRSLLKLVSFTIILVVLGAFTYQIAITQNGSIRHFPETGHSIEGEFLAFYQRISNPELIYGYPITGRMDSADGLVVQYFQRARFELHPEAPAGQQVQLTPLGERMYQPLIPFIYTKNPAVCRTFETGFDVCYAFWEFFDQHGGTAQFGPPISEVEEREGRLVQYFQNVRLEWHPDRAEIDLSQEMQLSFLGRQYFDQIGEDPVGLQPEQGNFGQEIISLRVHAFPVQAAVSSGEKQVLYVIVQDQNLNPVKDMSVTLQITYPTGTTASLILPQTNAFGYTSGDIPFSPQDGVGVVDIEVTAVNAAFETTTRASFRISP